MDSNRRIRELTVIGHVKSVVIVILILAIVFIFVEVTRELPYVIGKSRIQPNNTPCLELNTGWIRVKVVSEDVWQRTNVGDYYVDPK